MDALAKLTASLPGAEDRPGQRAMSEAVGECFRNGTVLLVEAGTGTGKSFAYLVPAIESKRRPILVATATKALQDQLIAKDVPALAAGLERPIIAIALKGRSSYLCRSKEDETRKADATLTGPNKEIERLLAWAETTETGDMAELDPAPSSHAWAELSVSANECPGAGNCTFGEECLSEQARADAAGADVVVVNHALVAVDLKLRSEAGYGFLPEAEAMVIDEAHRFEESLTSALGVDLGRRRIRYASGLARRLITDEAPPAALDTAGDVFIDELESLPNSRIDEDALAKLGPAAIALSQAIAGLSSACNVVPDDAGDAVRDRKRRLRRLLHALAVDLESALTSTDSDAEAVAWVEQDRLRSAPLSVSDWSAENLFTADERGPVVLTSATLRFGASFAHLRDRLGIEAATELTVDSPFDYRSNSVLYVPKDLPDPRAREFDAAARAEITRLLEASGGRAFCLFTSRRAMDEAHAEIGPLLEDRDPPIAVLRQGDAGPATLVNRFQRDSPAVLFATVSFWQGVDVPGDALELVIIDKLPFSSPGDPLASARTEAVKQAGGDWFADEVLPRAGLLLAQGVGRLIRRATDRGVVAVLDRRLAVAGYRQGLLATLPPLRRTVRFEEVAKFLGGLAAARGLAT